MRNTKIFASIMMSFIISSAAAEETKTDGDVTKKYNPPKTLLDIKAANWSAYGGVYTAYSRIGEANSCMVGGRGGVIINVRVVLGLGGAGMTFPSDREKISGIDYTGELDRVGFGYGGFLLEYYLNPKDLVVFSAGTLIGAGGIALYNKSDEDDTDQNSDHGDSFFVIEPEINVFVNITNFCRIGAGVSYRYTSGINTDELSDKDFYGPSAKIMAQFGLF